MTDIENTINNIDNISFTLSIVNTNKGISLSIDNDCKEKIKVVLLSELKRIYSKENQEEKEKIAKLEQIMRCKYGNK